MAGTPGRAQSPDTWISGMPANFGTATTLGNKFSIYCSYTPTLVTPIKSAEITTAVQSTLLVEPVVKVYPNPFTEILHFEFSSGIDTHARLELFNVAGSKIETLFDSNITGEQLYYLDYVPRLLASQLLFYRLTLGDKTQTGKVIYHQNY